MEIGLKEHQKNNQSRGGRIESCPLWQGCDMVCIFPDGAVSERLKATKPQITRSRTPVCT